MSDAAPSDDDENVFDELIGEQRSEDEAENSSEDDAEDYDARMAERDECVEEEEEEHKAEEEGLPLALPYSRQFFQVRKSLSTDSPGAPIVHLKVDKTGTF